MSADEIKFSPLTDEDQDLFNSYKDAITNQIHTTFPSIPLDYDIKPLGIRQQIGCGTFYTYRVSLPNNEIAEVAFHLGGKRAFPLVGPPHFEITKVESDI